MTRSQSRLLVVALAVAGVAACSTMNRSYMSGGDVDLSLATPAELGGDEVTLLSQMSDANIVGHLLTVDSLEITLSDTALRHVKTDDVVAFAKMMHLAHMQDENALRNIASSAGLVPTIDVSKLRSSHVAAGLDSVRKTSDITKDQQFIRAQIELHQHARAELNVLQSVPQNAALRAHVADMIPVVRDHLARAMALAKPLGVR
jgi:predicted outer membrane protein